MAKKREIKVKERKIKWYSDAIESLCQAIKEHKEAIVCIENEIELYNQKIRDLEQEEEQ